MSLPQTMTWAKPKLKSIRDSKSSAPWIRIVFVHPMKSKKYKEQRTKCIEELRRMSEAYDAQAQGFGFEQSKKSLQKNGVLRDLSTILLEAMLQQKHVHGRTKLVFVTFSIGKWVVQDALARPHRSESFFLACDTAAFIFELESPVAFSNLESEFQDRNRELIKSLEENFDALVRWLRQKGYDPTDLTSYGASQGQNALSEASELGRVENILKQLRTKSPRSFSWPLNKSVEYDGQLTENTAGVSVSEDVGDLRAHRSPRSNTFPPAVQRKHQRFLNARRLRQEFQRETTSRRPGSPRTSLRTGTSQYENSKQALNSSTEDNLSNQFNGEVVESEYMHSHDLESLQNQIALAQSLHQGGDLDQASICYSRTLETLDKILVTPQSSFENRVYAYQVKREIYAIELQQGHLETAERHLRETESEMRVKLDLDPRHPLSISFRLWLAIAQLKRGDARSALKSTTDLELDLEESKRSVAMTREAINLSHEARNRGQGQLDQDQQTIEKVESEGELRALRLTLESTRALALTQNGRYESAITLGRSIVRELDPSQKRDSSWTETSERDKPSKKRLSGHENATLVSVGKAKADSVSTHSLAEQFKEGQELISSGRRLSGHEKAALVSVGKAKADLAATYLLAEQFKESQEMNEEALSIMKQYLGEGHYRTLASASLRSALLAAVGSFREAEVQARSTLEIMQTRLRKSHPVTLQHLRTLACIFRLQGRFLKASARIRKLCSTYKEEPEFGLQKSSEIEAQWTHPEVIEAQCELSTAQLALGDVDAAMQTQQQVLNCAQVTLQPNHPVFARYQYVMACVLLRKEEWEQAIELAVCALDIHCKGISEPAFRFSSSSKFGSTVEAQLRDLVEYLNGRGSSSSTVSFLSILVEIELVAIAAYNLGKVEFAKEILGIILKIRESKAEEQQHHAIWTRLQIGKIHAKDELGTSIKYLDKARRDAAHALGEFHPMTLTIRHEKSVAQSRVGGTDVDRMQQIGQEQEDILQARISILGKDHPDTIGSWLDTAKTFYVLGKQKYARDCQRNAVDALEDPSGLFGPRHMKTLEGQLELAQLEIECGDIKRAREVQKKAGQHINSKELELLSRNILARIHCGDGDWEKAKEQFEYVSTACNRDRPLWRSNQLDYSLLLYDQDKYKEAERIQEDLDRRMGKEKFSENVLIIKYNLALTRRACLRENLSIFDMRNIIALAKSNLGQDHPRTSEMERILEVWTKTSSDSRPSERAKG